MREIETGSADLLLGASVYLGKSPEWEPYKVLYSKIYNTEGRRVLKKSGVFVVIQTNAYYKGAFVCRYNLLLNTVIAKAGWELIDERVWQRRKADHFQVPFSHVLVFRPPGGTAKRNDFNKRSKEWFRGIWEYPQTKGGKINGWPDALCNLIISACTDKGGLIADPFAGTGNLLGMAAAMGRRAIGYEIDEELIPIIRNNGCYVQKGTKFLRPKKRGFEL